MLSKRSLAPDGGDPIEFLLKSIGDGVVEDYKQLKQELAAIDANPSLV